MLGGVRCGSNITLLQRSLEKIGFVLTATVYTLLRRTLYNTSCLYSLSFYVAQYLMQRELDFLFARLVQPAQPIASGLGPCPVYQSALSQQTLQNPAQNHFQNYEP